MFIKIYILGNGMSLEKLPVYTKEGKQSKLSHHPDEEQYFVRKSFSVSFSLETN